MREAGCDGLDEDLLPIRDPFQPRESTVTDLGLRPYAFGEPLRK
jgi:hypothetical protein